MEHLKEALLVLVAGSFAVAMIHFGSGSVEVGLMIGLLAAIGAMLKKPFTEALLFISIMFVLGDPRMFGGGWSEIFSLAAIFCMFAFGVFRLFRDTFLVWRYEERQAL